jgi:hypothetical protein
LLDKGVLIIDRIDGETVEIQPIYTPQPTPQANIQLTIIPSDASGVIWNMQMTDFLGTRWDVWNRFVDRRVPDLTWEAFSELVILYNPQLEEDNLHFSLIKHTCYP